MFENSKFVGENTCNMKKEKALEILSLSISDFQEHQMNYIIHDVSTNFWVWDRFESA